MVCGANILLWSAVAVVAAVVVASLSSALESNAVHPLFDTANSDPDEPVNISFADWAVVERAQAAEQMICVKEAAS